MKDERRALSDNPDQSDKSEDTKVTREKEALQEYHLRIQNRIGKLLEAYPYTSTWSHLIDMVEGTVEIRLKLHQSKD